MIIIAGYLRVAADDRDTYLEAVEQVTAQARQAPGCLDFVQAADPLEDDRINVFERWEGEEELEAFRGSGPDESGAPPLLGAEVAKYRISAVEAP